MSLYQPNPRAPICPFESAMPLGLWLVLLGFVVPGALRAEDKRPSLVVNSVDWKGYSKETFRLDGHSAFVVLPKVAAAGKPWIWRTSFPDFHSEVDQQLLRSGFHVGYVDVVSMLGSDASLDIMDHYYDTVRQEWDLAERPALEPCSRGGLHAYRYAVRHPNRVACIFGDVPVMDLKSWPLGWPTAKQQVADAIRHYGFENEAALTAYEGNPLDLLATVAKARIPIRHVVCLNDAVVPPEQNTLEAQRRLRALGHDMDVVVIKSSPTANGHHFPMPQIFQSTRFVMEHAGVRPNSEEFFALRSGLDNSSYKFKTDKRGRVCFLGGSITYNPGWRDETIRYLRERFPKTKFDFISAGIPSVGSNGHAFRLQRDVLAKGPVDLVFVEAAVNDESNIPQQPDLIRRSMEGVIRHLRDSNPMTDIVQLHFAMGSHLEAYHQGEVPRTIEIHESVANHYGCPSVDIAKEVAARIDAGQFTWKTGFNSNVHPPAFGQQLYANSIARMLDRGFASTAASAPHSIPRQPLDTKSYIHGRFGNLADARLGAGFRLVDSWQPTAGRTREGFANVPALVASEPDASFTYRFDGTAFGLFLAAGFDSCVLEFQVDGGPPQTIDTFTRWSRGLHLPWPIILADGLKPGAHEITVRTTQETPKRTALHVIQILLN